MKLFTGWWKPSAQADRVPLELDHDKADWTDVCNRAFSKIHPDKKFQTPQWLQDKYRTDERKTA